MKLQRKQQQQKIGKYDIVGFLNGRTGLNSECVYMVMDILSMTPNGSVEADILNLGKFSDVMDSKFNPSKIYTIEVFFEELVPIGSLKEEDAQTLIGEYHKSNVPADIPEAHDFEFIMMTDDPTLEEVFGMISERQINDIVMDADQARIFINKYRDEPNDSIKKEYDIKTNKQLMKIVNDIINMYRFNRR